MAHVLQPRKEGGEGILKQAWRVIQGNQPESGVSLSTGAKAGSSNYKRRQVLRTANNCSWRQFKPFHFRVVPGSPSQKSVLVETEITLFLSGPVSLMDASVDSSDDSTRHLKSFLFQILPWDGSKG